MIPYRVFLAAVMVALPLTAMADKLVYSFINPSFGGSPFLANSMLAKAQIQYTPPVIEVTPQSDAEYFASQIQRRALSSISSALLGSLRDLDVGEDGTFTFDEMTIDYYSEGGTLYFNINDGVNDIDLELPDYAAMLLEEE